MRLTQRTHKAKTEYTSGSLPFSLKTEERKEKLFVSFGNVFNRGRSPSGDGSWAFALGPHQQAVRFHNSSHCWENLLHRTKCNRKECPRTQTYNSLAFTLKRDCIFSHKLKKRKEDEVKFSDVVCGTGIMVVVLGIVAMAILADGGTAREERLLGAIAGLMVALMGVLIHCTGLIIEAIDNSKDQSKPE